MKLIKRSLIVINLLLLAGLYLGFARQFMDPGHEVLFTTCSLLFPYITMGVFIVFLLLVILQSFWAWISLVSLIAVSGSIVRQIGFHIHPGAPVDSTVYTITTFNTKDDFTFQDTDQRKAFLDDFSKNPPDILALQEVSHRTIAFLKDKMNYPHSSHESGSVVASPMGVLSNHPVEEVEFLKNDEGRIIALACDIHLKNTSIRLINIHLHSNAVTVRASKFSPESISRKEGLREFNAMLRSYNKNALLRQDELELVHELVSRSPHPVIMVGDVNDTPLSMAYRRLRGDFQDAFVEKGFGLAKTYDELLIPLKIDHIFADLNFHFFNVNIRKVNYSDHNPMSAIFSVVP